MKKSQLFVNGNDGKYGTLTEKSAFSLAEMMVVMLIMSIVLAAMAPIITTRIKADQALKAGEAAAPQEDNNPWKWVEDSETDAYSQASRNMIGQSAAEEDDGDAMLIFNKGKDDKNDILFKNSNGIVGRLDMWNLSSDYKGLILGDTTTNSYKYDGGISIGFGNAIAEDRFVFPTSSVMLGYKNTIEGEGRNAMVFGTENTVNGLRGTVIGKSNNVKGNDLYVLGENNTTPASSSGGGSCVIGERNTEIGANSYLFGQQNKSPEGGYAFGSFNELNGYNSVVVGYSNTTALASPYDTGTGYAFGGVNSVSGPSFSMAIGMGNETTGDHSIAMGNYSKATAYYSIAIGSASSYKKAQTTASGQWAFALAGAQASGNYSVGMGRLTLASGDYSVAIGNSAHATGKSSLVICPNDGAAYNDDGNTRYPYSAIASGLRSVAIGYRALAEKDYDFVLGSSKHNVKIPGTLAVSQTLTVKGTAVQSDKRLKYIKGENKNGLDAIKKMKVYNFTFKKDKDKEPRVGVIAQELQKILPDAVKKGSDGFLTIRIDDIIYTLVNAVKELDRKVSELTETLKQVQAEQKRINQRLDALEHKSVH